MEENRTIEELKGAVENLEEKLRRKTAELNGLNRSLETQISRRVRAEEMLHRLLKATSSVAGEEFLRTLVRQLATSLEFRYALIAEYAGDGHAETLFFWANGSFGQNFVYELAGTPCESVMKGEICAYKKGVRGIFPEDRYFDELSIESYVGIPLLGVDERPIGILVAMDTRPMEAEEEAKTIMRLFALRASLELQRKRAEEEKRRSMEMLQAIMDNSSAVIYMKDAEGRFIFLNKWYIEKFGVKEAEMLGRTDFDVFPVELAQRLRENDARVLAAGRPLEFEEKVVEPGGSEHTYISIKFPIPYMPGAVCGISTDITERKAMEEELRLSEKRLNEAQATAHVGSWEWDITTNALHWSDEIYRIFGLKPQGFGATYEAFLATVHPDDMEAVKLAVDDAFRNRAPYEISHRIVRPDGTERIVNEKGGVVFDGAGRPLKMVGTVQDVTEHKKMEAEILKAQKLDSIGVLAGGIAHDFNNLLLGILGNVSVAKNYLKPEDKVSALLNEIEKAALRTKSLTRQLLTFSKGGLPVREPASMEEIVRESAQLVLRGTELGCDFSIPGDLWPVEVDQGQISQALNNIVLNASQAMPDGGSIRITAENIEVDANGDLPLKPGRYTRTTIRDYGIGIPPKLLAKIFDPFFTTKQKASGLGLAVTYSIVKKHGGHIGVDSELSEGSSFHVYLPASKEQPQAQPKEGEPVAKGAGRVLVMDDEELVLDVSGEMLSLLGYEAVFALDGAEAVDAYGKAMEEGKPFSAVILDLTVPGGMGGMDAMKRLLEIDPGVKAIVSSGYSKDPIMADYRRYGFSAVIAKPYRVAEFSQAVKGVTSGAR